MKLFNKTNTDENKGPFWKKLFILIGIIVVMFSAVVGWGVYRQIQDEKAVDELARGLEQAHQDQQARQLADEYGGETPKETLRLFIDAVERGNYNLASKYFVLEKQEEWEAELQELEENGHIESLLGYLNEAMDSPGEGSFDNKTFGIYDPIYVDFVIYPSGNWKIREI